MGEHFDIPAYVSANPVAHVCLTVPCRLCHSQATPMAPAVPDPTVEALSEAEENDACASCGEGIPEGECPKSKRPCGHHCNHVWTHDACDWCGIEFGDYDGSVDHDAPCVFCRIATGDSPAQIVAQEPDVLAFRPLDPVTEGHVLVVPREHVINFMHKPQVTARVAEYAAWLAAHWMDGGDTNLITSAGGFATQTVRHLHFHIVPRRRDDGLALPWTGQARARAAAPDALRVAVEALADEWQEQARLNERAGHFPWAMWQNRANDLRALLEDGAVDGG